jgi:hypothetical protein
MRGGSSSLRRVIVHLTGTSYLVLGIRIFSLKNLHTARKVNVQKSFFTPNHLITNCLVPAFGSESP